VEDYLIGNIELENGLVLKMFDLSRPVAGDRWIVSFEARIEVKIKPQYFDLNHTSPVSLDDIRALLGQKIVYRYKKERHFVGEHEKKEVLNHLKQNFLETGLRYLSSYLFPQKFILRRYKEASSKMNLSI
jgi:hypothetical protein